MFTRNFSALGCVTILLTTVFSCTVPEPKQKELEPNYLLSLRIRPTWFKYRKDRANKSQENRLQGHPFFDFNPFVNIKSQTLNFFTVTPYLNNVLFDLDLSSGRRYRVHNLCAQKDVWSKYSHRIKGPPFTHGIVPRTVDQLGRPQEIFVFGNERVLGDFPGLYAHRVKVVGGVILQECPFGNCQPDQWKSRMALVAVDPSVDDFKDIKSLDELRSEIDWKYFEAYIQNYKGHVDRFQKRFPYLRKIGEVSATNALRVILKPDQSLTKDDRLEIASSCHRLYDFALKTIGPRSSKKNYYKRFRDFFHKFESEYQTCMNYVQFDSINFSIDNHWFFAYLEAFMQVHDLNYVVNCSNSSWEKITDMPSRFSKKRYLNLCSDKAIEVAVETAPFMLKKFALNNLPSQKYVEYDSLKGGSHEKVYSFVEMHPSTINCPENDRKGETFFPKDIKWKSKLILPKDPTIIN